MDTTVQCERDDMDNKVRQERAAVDKVMKQEHEKMEQKFKSIHEQTKMKLKSEREEMDRKVMEERAATDQAFKQEHEKLEKQFKKIRKDMNQKLQQDRDDMDRTIELERAKMDCKNMQARADMDQKLRQKREEIESKAVLEQVNQEAKIMQDHTRIDRKIPPTEQSDSKSRPGLVMDFNIYKDRELSDIPKGYLEGKPGSMIINEPGKVEWYLMVEHLAPHDYRGLADLYYIEPGCVPPNGMVLIESPEHVEQMIQALKGRKKCDLYIIRNGPPSIDSYGYDGMAEEDSWGEASDTGKWDTEEDGSSPRTEQPELNTHKRALNFSSDDEDTST
ncbi:hypothetical protein ACQ4PT_059555 [Festuca glaucescens]